MRVEAARSDVNSLMFRLFSRSVHPELIVCLARTTIHKPNWHAELAICESGHLIAVHLPNSTVCEIVCPADWPVPLSRQVIGRRLKGSRDESVEHDGGLLYHTSFQVEQLDPDLFQHCHEELCEESTRARLKYGFAPTSRLATAPLSFLHTEERNQSLLVHTFHTFPENRAIVKTQTLFEI
jgi:Protein of unknown function DUF2617